MKYIWLWKDNQGNDKHITIDTFRSKDDARKIAISYFKNDIDSIKYITDNEPLIESN